MLGSIVEFRPLPSFLRYPMLALEVGAAASLVFNLFKPDLEITPQYRYGTLKSSAFCVI